MRPAVARVLLALLLACAASSPSGCRRPEPVSPLISPQELWERMERGEDLLLLDVRSEREFRAGHAPGARHIPHTRIRERLEELRPYRNRDVVVTCEVGVRAAEAERVLREAGFSRVFHLEGDMAGWRRWGLPVEASSAPGER